ncbi:MAG: AAA family ATPase, partial [Patescibacteria group bacterium]|nr:AAA family ATPase [Patescibacteria group bacterium]
MRLKSAQVQNYRSIIDSGIVEMEYDITALVGMTSSGKTSFLTMLAGLNPSIVFTETELPNGSETKQKFQNGELPANKILQLTAVFTIDNSDQEFIPEEFKGISEIKIYRFFDGHFEIVTSKNTFVQGNVVLATNITTIRNILEVMKANFTNAQPRIGHLVQFTDQFLKAIDAFLQTNFSNLKELDLSLQSLTNTINGIPKDGPLQNEFNQRIAEINTERSNISKALENDPVKKLINVIPKPSYKSDVIDLQDNMLVDNFINKPETSNAFHSLAIISGLKPSGVQKIRNASPADQNSYFDVISKTLSEQLNNFWRQEKYDFKIGISNNQLSFTVADRLTGKETSVLDGSEGFKWWTSFFLGMSADLTEKPGLSIILLDNPATSLHDDGKGDVLKFLVKMA